MLPGQRRALRLDAVLRARAGRAVIRRGRGARRRAVGAAAARRARPPRDRVRACCTGNPLGDPDAAAALRLPAARASSVDHPKALASVYVIQGYTGQLDMWLGRQPFEPTMIERLDAMFAGGRVPGRDRRLRRRVDVLRRLAVPELDRAPAATWTTCATRSSPFVDERYPTRADRDHRGLTGKSSGGYGAMVVPMLRPDVFGALASHAGDALFEACYLPEFPNGRADAARRLRRLVGRLLRARARRRPGRAVEARRTCSSLRLRAGLLARPDDAGQGAAARSTPTGGCSTTSGRSGWSRDPVRMAPAHADALRSMRRIYLDAGRARRVLPRPRRAGLRGGARQARRRSTRSSSSTARTRA